MDAAKRQRYDKISEELTELVGGRDNIQGVAHCATRLRIVLKDNDLADLKAIEDVDLAKGVFVAGDQVQIIFGAWMVNDGMSDLEQLKQNIETFQTEKTLQKNEMKALFAVADGMLNGKLPCTSCRYCTSHCPQQLDIPRLLELYNEHTFTGGGFIAPMVMATIPKEKQPSACVGCRSCEAVCPQQIKISEAMSDFASKLNG